MDLRSRRDRDRDPHLSLRKRAGTERSGKPTVLYIASAAHSGSTLLELLLANHPQVTGLGEVHRLSLVPDSQLCGCGDSVARCAFWTRVGRRMADIKGAPPAPWDRVPIGLHVARRQFRRAPSPVEICLMLGTGRGLRMLALTSAEARRYLEVAAHSWLLCNVVAELEGTRSIVDCSGAAARFKLLYVTGPERVRIVHLVRDGRAFTAWARSETGCTIDLAARYWIRRSRNILRMLRTMPSSRVHLIRYEELCDATDSVLLSLCRFAGLPFWPEMTTLGPRLVHTVGGGHKPRPSGDIVKDETWYRELSRPDLRAFDVVAGRFNRSLGYD